MGICVCAHKNIRYTWSYFSANEHPTVNVFIVARLAISGFLLFLALGSERIFGLAKEE